MDIQRESIPMVSIVMPVYNSELTVKRSVMSILRQSFSSFELIIVDDFSDDGSLDVINKLSAKDDRIKIIPSKENYGTGVARNIGIENARGRYICFLDADDEWVEDKLNYQIEFMKAGNHAFAASEYYIRPLRGKIFIKRLPQRITYKDLLKENIIGCLTVCLDTKYLGKRRFPEIRKRQDYALWLEILKEGWFCEVLNFPLAFYNVQEKSVSSNPLKNIYFNYIMFRTVLNHNYLNAVYYLLLNILSKFKRIIISKLSNK